MQSDEIASVTLHKERPLLFHLYVFPYLFLYPLLAWAYYVEYDRYIRSEEWTFVYTVLLTSSHALSFLVTRWNVRARAWITSTTVRGCAADTRPTRSPRRTACKLCRMRTRARAAWCRCAVWCARASATNSRS